MILFVRCVTNFLNVEVFDFLKFYSVRPREIFGRVN